MQIKIIIRYYLTPLEWLLSKTENNKCWQRYGQIGTLIHCWWECKMVQLLCKTVWQFFKKLKIELLYDPAIPILGIYPKELKAGVLWDICTLVFIAALFTIAKTWKQPKCPSIGEWINKICYIHTMKYHSALDILTHATTWMNLEDILLSEISQSQKNKYCMIPLV